MERGALSDEEVRSVEIDKLFEESDRAALAALFRILEQIREGYGTAEQSNH